MARGLSAFRPGWARLGVSWFFDDQTVADIGAAIAFVARRGLSLLPVYGLNPGSGTWRASPERLPGLISPVPAIGTDFAAMWAGAPAARTAAPDFASCLAEADRIADLAERCVPAKAPAFDAEAESLRWFWMPGEAATALRGAA